VRDDLSAVGYFLSDLLNKIGAMTAMGGMNAAQ
jgi:hypothetical protein